MAIDFKFWKRSKQAKKKSFVREWSDSIIFAVIAATLIRWTTVEAFVVPTPSMENTVLVGDYLFVSKFHYGTRITRTPLQIPLTHQKFGERKFHLTYHGYNCHTIACPVLVM